jgi:predicted nucleic acid-binding protein
MSAFVIDASITLSWLLADEANADSAAIERALRKADVVWVPAHWRLEVVNAIWMAERRKRLDGAGVSQAIAFCSQMQVTVDGDTDKHAPTETLALARQHGISVYDAAYLELALRKGGTLASLDVNLREVAEKNGVAVVPR